MQTLTLKRADDWHIHLRDGVSLKRTVPDAAQCFNRVVVMPNLMHPIKTVDEALRYRDAILACHQAGTSFTPLMTLYLTDQTEPSALKHAKTQGVVACKLYPQGATTNSKFGVKNIAALSPVFQAMSEAGLLLLIHGEVVDPATDIFDREKIFIESILAPLLNDFPDLKVVLEHITTQVAVDFVRAGPANLAATITAHHLWLNRNDLLSGGIRPHHYCLPVVKRESDRLSLVEAAISGHPRFFLGTDSAPHAQGKKECASGCAGIYTALHALPLYAEIFEKFDALNKLEGFASEFGPDFYGLPQNQETITLTKLPWTVPEHLSFGDTLLIPFLAGHTLQWSLS